jgi:DNA-binding NtrC family response regulator
MQGTILIIEDNKSVLTALEMLLQENRYQVIGLKNPNSLLTTLRENTVDSVLLDMNFKAGVNSGNEGLYWLRRIQEFDPTISVIMITAYGDVELAVKAVKEGAFDFILKPWDNAKLLATLKASLSLGKSKRENQELKQKNQQLRSQLKGSEQPFIGNSPGIQKVLDMIAKVAPTDANILITGENGTGKELIAREIHAQSKRSDELLVSIDMGAISETLFESELFGHAKGAFTDAHDERTGKFETAQKGTLFFDEIGNLPLAMQAKLLAALQNRTITRVGSNLPIPIDIRLISATNRNLNQLVADKLFREDLLYRLNTITIEIPPLRERNSDIQLLANYFLSKYRDKYLKPELEIAPKALQRLQEHHWPGNVRELQHCMERAVILADGDMLNENSFILDGQTSPLKNLQFTTIEAMEKLLIQKNMETTGGNLSAIAKNLGITRQTLYNKMKKYDL